MKPRRRLLAGKDGPIWLRTISRSRSRRQRRLTRKTLAGATATLMVASLAPASVLLASPAASAPVGAGFQLSRGDLEFILKQIKISETHVASRTAEGTYPCSSMLGTGENQIPNDGPNGEVLPWGLRTVSGTCNNLVPNQENFGAADQPFPHRVPRVYRVAEEGTDYGALGTNVVDSQPRVISNLIVDQTKNNEAAVAASGLPEADITAAGNRDTLSIPNVAPDVGLSAPFNSVFTLFGQFFDHGLDLVAKQGAVVRVPLKDDDPLVLGPDGTAGTGDDLPAPLRFMMMTRAKLDANGDAINLTTPFVDQNQTYTSHPSHQVFLRQYVAGTNGPLNTGHLIESDEGMATWARVKQQSADLLGIQLTDFDMLDIPKLVTDPYGHFIPGPNGYPQIMLEGGGVHQVDPTDGPDAVPDGVPAGEPTAVRTGHAFLDDIAHNAVPVGPTGAPLTPDLDTDVNGPAPRPAGTYDNELLDTHFIAGDGRANENIGLTAIHHIFHSEHNRLADEINGMLEGIENNANATAADHAFYAEWHADAATAGSWAYGERLFQAARFVTEMEYQHLVFEEFARKVQPMVNLFGEGGTGYETTTNAAIAGEFAHAVYRFGHSMLTETVARRNVVAGAPVNNDIGLIQAFLNPPSFRNGGNGVTLTPDQAAGSIFRGMSRQVGNEIDEFVTEALRNNLLGLPLDLPTINLARARDTGVPPLNAVRARFFAESNNSALKPYESWADFGFSLKHSESLVNFIAAYGQHPTITSATTLAAKRAAAKELVNPTPVPADIDPAETDPAVIEAAQAAAQAATDAKNAEASDFMFAKNDRGVTDPASNWATAETGINLVDLWVGGLAEKQMVFGGLLGSTFNYVFEHQLEDLQFADRFYYLSRTQGLNLLVQLEGNSFAELIMRNTDVGGLPSDVFSRPDFVFNMKALGTSGPVPDDPTTLDWNEANVLTRMPDGTIRFAGPEHTVWNGVDAEDLVNNPGLNVNDRMQASEGDDTLRGNSGNDVMEGGDGVDNLIGGEGDDVLKDIFGDDVLKGGPGNDALSSGQGFAGDLNQGGFGKDFIVGGNDTTETFGGPDDDFIFAGEGEDTVFGDDGSDWIEGGKGPFNLLQGDGGQAFQNDPNGGHDVIQGLGGEQDYDSEGGDDIMLAAPGIQRSEGMLGFDWVTHKSDPTKANSDMDITGLLPPTINDLRDRFDLVEGLSGWQFDDVLRGDSRAAADLGGDLEHSLTAAGIERIQGLASLLPAGATSFNAGNIIIGGSGSDLIEGRGGDDILDGDAWLNVKVVAPDLSTTDPSDTKEFDTIRALQTDVFAQRINPGELSILRRIEVAGLAADVDTAAFTGVRDDYTVTSNDDGSVTVTHDGGGVDGVDTLRNIERLQFSDVTVDVQSITSAPDAPTNVSAVAGNASATVSWVEPLNTGGSPITEYQIQAFAGATPVLPVTTVTAPATSGVVTGLTNGTTYTFQVVAVTANGSSAPSAPSNAVTPAGANPVVASTNPADGATGVDVGSNVTATFDRNVTNVSGTTFRLFNAATGVRVPAAVSYNATTFTATLNPNANLATDTLYEARLTSGIRSGTNRLANTNWTFRTAADTTGPSVVASGPAANATGVALGTNVRGTFSERVLGVNGTTVQLHRGDGSGPVVAAQVTLNAAGTIVTLNPNANLARNTQYTIVLTPPIRDVAGNQLITTSWSFRTRT